MLLPMTNCWFVASGCVLRNTDTRVRTAYRAVTGTRQGIVSRKRLFVGGNFHGNMRRQCSTAPQCRRMRSGRKRGGATPEGEPGTPSRVERRWRSARRRAAAPSRRAHRAAQDRLDHHPACARALRRSVARTWHPRGAGRVVHPGTRAPGPALVRPARPHSRRQRVERSPTRTAAVEGGTVRRLGRTFRPRAPATHRARSCRTGRIGGRRPPGCRLRAAAVRLPGVRLRGAGEGRDGAPVLRPVRRRFAPGHAARARVPPGLPAGVRSVARGLRRQAAGVPLRTLSPAGRPRRALPLPARHRRPRHAGRAPRQHAPRREKPRGTPPGRCRVDRARPGAESVRPDDTRWTTWTGSFSTTAPSRP